MNWDKLRQEYDKKEVLGWLRKFSDQIIEAVYHGKKFKAKKRKIDKIVGCGMGGSGVGAEILRNILKEELKVPFEVFHSYKLPAYVDKNTLVFCVSFSGNTEETIACFKQAKQKRAYVVSVSTDGKLKRMAKSNLILVPASAPQPRMGLAYVCLPILVVLEKLGLVEKKNHQLNETVFLLKKEEARLEQKARELALRMRNKLPIIYAPEELQTVAYRFRTELNENSKQFALHHFLPEHNHNEINAWLGVNKKSCEIFLLRHQGELKKVSKRFTVLRKIMGKHFNITEINLKGKSLTAVTFYALQLAALTSYHLALLNKIDPEPVPFIKVLKKELKK